MSLNIKENEPLANHSTFRIGGPAKFFIEANSIEEIKEAIDFAKSKSLIFFVLGGGSNVLFSDEGYNGVVIKNNHSSLMILNSECVASGGTPLGLLISKTAEAGLSGLEWGVGIPGTVGGGVAGNCGAYGSAIADNLVGVTTLEKDGSIKQYSKQECVFSYRSSIFKQKKGESIILEVEFKFREEEKSLIKEKIKEISGARVGNIPPYPSAGSVFKNMVFDELANREELAKIIPAEKIKGGKLPAGYLIEACGLRGKKIGGGLIAEQHANFIVNAGGAKSADIVELINLCKSAVKEKFGIDLEEEIIVL